MFTKKAIAIIGASGKVARFIASRFASGNYRLLVFDKKPSVSKALVDNMLLLHPSADIEGYDCPVNSSWEADIIILAMPRNDEQSVVAEIKEVANQKIVISLAENITGKALDKLQAQLPFSKIVGLVLAQNDRSISTNSSFFFEGEDDEAVALVKELFKQPLNITI